MIKESQITKRTPWNISIQGIDSGSDGISRENTKPALVPDKDVTKPYLCRELLVETMLEKYNVKMIKFGTKVVIARISVVDHNAFTEY